MKKILILAGVAALALLFTACDKESGESVSSDNGTKAITVTISGANLTKSSQLPATGDGTWETTAATSSYQIYFTDANGKILYAYSINSTDNSEQMSALTNKGIRFINLTGVTAVYVTANASEANTLSAGSNVSSITEYLYNQSALKDNTDILYIGADDALTIGDEDGGATYTYSYDTDSWTNTTDSDPAYTASQYYKAEVSIRPIISRLEIAQIQAETSGTTWEENETNLTAEYDGVTYEYVVTWQGFTPDLKGIYMSNFYGSIIPTTPKVDNLFETPSGDPIDGTTYLWGSTATIESAYNVDGVSLYSDSGTNLFAADANGVYFNGHNTDVATQVDYCVPFNFFVPFDVTKIDDTLEKDESIMAVDPKYHFLFYIDLESMSSYTYQVYAKEVSGTASSDNLSSDASNEILNAADASKSSATVNAGLYAALTSDFSFTSVADGNYYANISYLADNNGDPITISSNKIYKLDVVTIAPYNLTSSTVSSDSYNLIVVVTPVDYVAENVTAVFD